MCEFVDGLHDHSCVNVFVRACLHKGAYFRSRNSAMMRVGNAKVPQNSPVAMFR